MAKIQNLPFKFHYFSFQYFKFVLAYFSPLNFKTPQFCHPLHVILALFNI